MVVNGPLSLSLACLGLKHHYYRVDHWSKYIDIDIDICRSTVVEPPLPEQRSPPKAGFYASHT